MVYSRERERQCFHGNSSICYSVPKSKLDHFSVCVFMDTYTGWINVNLLYFPDSTEIASPEGLTLWCPEIIN